MSLTYTTERLILPFEKDGIRIGVDISNRSTGDAPCRAGDDRTLVPTAAFLSGAGDRIEVHVVGTVGGALSAFFGLGFDEAVTPRRWMESLAFARVAIEDRFREMVGEAGAENFAVWNEARRGDGITPRRRLLFFVDEAGIESVPGGEGEEVVEGFRNLGDSAKVGIQVVFAVPVSVGGRR